MATYSVYFSPTGNTKKSVISMAHTIDQDAKELDLTLPASQPADFGRDDFVIFGAPVYGGRIPIAAMDRLNRCHGDSTPCILVACYGNRHYDDALLELADMAKANGFIVKGAAATVGRHTFGHIQENRPDEADIMKNTVFAKAAVANDREVSVPGSRPYKDGGNGGKFRPSTLDSCVRCGLCKRACPMGAIGEDFSAIDDSRCISCFRCIRICPKGAKAMVSPAYDAFAEGFTAKLSAARENEYFL